MSVFLRWGIFGILGFAGLMYAYNASKQMAEKHAASKVAVVSPSVQPAAADDGEPRVPTPCEVELMVAQRALDARRQGEPIDRLMRIQEIAFEDLERRRRLDGIAATYYNWAGAEPTPETLQVAIMRGCAASVSPAP
jgi:hypothetical protein